MRTRTGLLSRPIVTLGDPPKFEEWPVAQRSAAILHGALLRCGPGVRGIGWPDDPRIRAAALTGLLRGRIATGLTAAWVWGTARQPGQPLQANSRFGSRDPFADTEFLRVREHRYAETEVTALGRCTVTTRQRTILDLLYTPEPFGRVEQVACRLLGMRVDGGLVRVAEHLHTHRRPYRRRALERLGSIFDSAAH